GKMVEYGDVLQIFENPKHPYTKGLLACRPKLDTKYRLLPTVSDFMETRTIETPEGPDVEIIEKKLDDARLNELITQGRGRLLHPRAELEAMGHPWEEGHHSPDSTMVPDNEKPLLEVHNLQVHFPVRKGVFSRVVGHVKAVDGISFNVYRGQTLGLVGESGCGKTTTGRAILKLIRPTGGSILFEDQNVATATGAKLKRLRSRMQIIRSEEHTSELQS